MSTIPSTPGAGPSRPSRPRPRPVVAIPTQPCAEEEDPEIAALTKKVSALREKRAREEEERRRREEEEKKARGAAEKVRREGLEQARGGGGTACNACAGAKQKCGGAEVERPERPEKKKARVMRTKRSAESEEERGAMWVSEAPPGA